MNEQVSKVTGIVIGVIILFSILAAMWPTLTSSAASLNTSGAPMASLYMTVVPLVIIAGVVLAVIYGLLRLTKGKK